MTRACVYATCACVRNGATNEPAQHYVWMWNSAHRASNAAPALADLGLQLTPQSPDQQQKQLCRAPQRAGAVKGHEAAGRCTPTASFELVLPAIPAWAVSSAPLKCNESRSGSPPPHGRRRLSPFDPERRVVCAPRLLESALLRLAGLFGLLLGLLLLPRDLRQLRLEVALLLDRLELLLAPGVAQKVLE